MHLNKDKNLYYVMLIILLFSIFINTINLYYTDKQIKINKKYKKNTTELLLINQNINSFFTKSMNYIEYEMLDKKLNKFQNILNKLQENEKIHSLFTQDFDSNFFILMKGKFQKKSILVKEYIADYSKLNKALKQFTKIMQEIRIKKNNQNINNSQSIHSLILRSLGENININKILKKIKIFKEKNKDTDIFMYGYYEKAEFIINLISKTRQQTLRNKQININQSIEDFNKELEKYSKMIVDRLYTSLTIFLILIILFVLITFILFKKISIKNQKLLQFQQAVQNSDNAIVITDLNHKIKYVNTAFEKTTGYTAKEAIGQDPSILQSGLHDKCFYDDIKTKLKNEESWTGEFSNRRKDGQIIHEKASIHPIYDRKNKLEGYLGIKLDITSEKSYLQEIETKNMEILARYQIDDETGLWSRNILIEELTKKTSGYIIYIKIDTFSDLRIFYGTSTASIIFQKAAHILKRFISIYRIDAQPFRIGADDFCIWYKHKKPPQDLFEAINDYFKSNPIEVDKTIHTIRLIMGISSESDLPNGDRFLQGIMAYYEARQQNVPYVYYIENNKLEKEYRKNIIITQKIRYALENDLVSVECQPIFFTDTKKIYNYEVLMRIRDEKGKMMYPGEFLEVAKYSSLYTPLMHRVISLVFELISHYPKLRFSINMSIIDMLDKKTVNLFMKCLELCDNPKNLILEILESEGIENYDDIKPFLNEVHSCGAQIVIDDFGSGYSNYYRIMQLNVDHIKIDGSIIKELPYDKNSRVVVETILSFAKRKGWKVVAEFVSNEKIYEMVKKYKIDFTQGFFLGKPEEIKIKKD